MRSPRGLLARSADETQTLLQDEFSFFAGDLFVPGHWRHDEDASNRLDCDDVFFYRIREDWLPSANNGRPARVLRDFRDLSLIDPPSPQQHELGFQLRAKRHGIVPFGDLPEVLVKRESPLPEAHTRKLVVAFPDYWPWYLLTATQEHATWEEIRLAFETMNFGDVRLRFYAFQQIEQQGMTVRRGRRWTDFENRIQFGRHEGGCYTVRYSGLTSPIYGVLHQIEPLDPIAARWERGFPPHLEMRFPLRGDTDRRLREACQRAGIRTMRESLWKH